MDTTPCAVPKDPSPFLLCSALPIVKGTRGVLSDPSPGTAKESQRAGVQARKHPRMRCRRNAGLLAQDPIIGPIAPEVGAHGMRKRAPTLLAPPTHGRASNRVWEKWAQPYIHPYRACMRKGPSCSSGGVPPAQGATSSVSGRTSAEGLQTLMLR